MVILAQLRQLLRQQMSVWAVGVHCAPTWLVAGAVKHAALSSCICVCVCINVFPCVYPGNLRVTLHKCQAGSQPGLGKNQLWHLPAHLSSLLTRPNEANEFHFMSFKQTLVSACMCVGALSPGRQQTKLAQTVCIAGGSFCRHSNRVLERVSPFECSSFDGVR